MLLTDKEIILIAILVAIICLNYVFWGDILRPFKDIIQTLQKALRKCGNRCLRK